MQPPETDTIVGLATPPGAAGVAVIRLSGRQACDIAKAIVPGLRTGDRTRSLRLHRVIGKGPRVLDQALVCVMRGPHSYTAEDIVELQLHGGVATVAAVLRAATAAGARVAAPGEFTLRAFLNGRIDLCEAEAVGALVGARSERARAIALRQLAGGLGEVVVRLRGQVIDVLAEVEARLDFPEEDLEAFSVAPLLENLGAVTHELDHLISGYPAARLAMEGARVALVGRPNVGKSSLLNALVGRARAIVDAAPGTTRDYLEDELRLEGVTVTVVDTAGQRAGEAAAERTGVAWGWDQALLADLVLLVVHLGEGVTQEDRRLMGDLEGKEWGVVLNHRDRVDTQTAKRAAHDFETVYGITNARDGTGIEALRARLLHRFTQGDGELPLVTERRHEQVLRETREGIRLATQHLQTGAPEELAALELRGAAERLGNLVGIGVTEDVLEAIFSRFCIGK